MLRKIMIFGGGGFVGRNLAREAQKQGWLPVIADSLCAPEGISVQWIPVDITDAEAVKKVITEVKPLAVVNLAALADIDKAETNKDLAWRINVMGASNIAKACVACGAKHVFFSSDAVFDGLKSCYTEKDKPAPVNYYGETKRLAEKEILEVDPTAAVIRISLVLGFSVAGGNSFLDGLEKKLLSDEKVYCPLDEIRTPIDVLTLCESVLELAGNSFSGILHIGAQESIGRYALSHILAEKMGFITDFVTEQHDTVSSRAPRHKNGIICVTKASFTLKTPMLSLEQTIIRALNSRT